MDEQPFHPLILELAADLDEDPKLSEEDASAWATRLSNHAEAEELAVHLAVLAMRLGKQGIKEAAAQLVYIAALAFNASAAAQVATAAGMQVAEAKKLTGFSGDPTKKRTVGLAAPTISALRPRKK
jgi:hypothetical protein